MKFIKKSYYYFFYRIYRSIEFTSELSGGKFLTFFKAGVVMIALEIWIFFSFGNYYTICSKTFVEITFSMPIIYIPLLIIVGFNYFTLDYKDNWKKYNGEFANYSKRKNRIGGWIVFGIILIIIFNLIFSFYLVSQVDWSQYR
ncbi:hypothetical protein D0817_20730 [Flavobacterium cupreum]|uniref:Uncharacterized protein n=1 Tax=Flavobacterium cupreum TaxID=2133766 RepID=A0A434A2D9_9FLAO|nr:hypothetical protein [Flavobacterium cupreum]RUT68553.1 hypothetical protein D0817_20730 [Flavobacterium cupreum]